MTATIPSHKFAAARRIDKLRRAGQGVPYDLLELEDDYARALKRAVRR